MTAKEKALELVDKYKPFVYPFMGSSYLTGDGYDEVILRNSKICALIAVIEILNEPDCSEVFWQEVKQEIELL